MLYTTNREFQIDPDASHDYESNCQRFGTRVQLGSYIADIVADDVENPSIHHCIVQRVGSPRVLYLGQEDSFAAPLASGYRHLEELAGARSKQTGAIYEFKAPQPK
jgi:hypothetical protein